RPPVRERIGLLLDEGSWFETGLLAQPERRTGKKVPGDGVVTGFGRMDGRTVGLTGIDATALAGTTAPVSMRKQGRLIEQGQRFGYPLVLLCDAAIGERLTDAELGGPDGAQATGNAHIVVEPRRTRSRRSPRSCPTCRPARRAPRPWPPNATASCAPTRPW